MSVPNMRAIELSASSKAGELARELEVGHRPPEEVERILFHLSRYARAAGIAHLLAYADGATFRQHLLRSGEARRQLLQLARQQGRPVNRFTATGNYGPLCDALAAGADETARDIARLSFTEHVRRDEYEDDFHYARFLGWLVAGDEAQRAEAEGFLDAFERVLQGESSPRLDLCRALMAHEQEGLDSALKALLEERERHFHAKAKSWSVKDEHYETERFVFVEGLALLRLAERRGLSVQAEYLFMPGLARAS
ncbi:immunity 49 family protein [Pyxidicoccus parkwayensis]|uniref:Immunity 49 family protein n=1 Tax=Pyxidicoccus parkwayensis TaxID=2813578 RepID=A0ABX7NU92_9BACT|nr:Imm49 family immunity protein [Pyxidicoccus parkwaysis]QSQ22278.1 immunity 49 family protein [Pyxidicoccus parkwaysis]